MPDFSSTDWITALGLLVLVVTLGSPRVFKNVTDTSPETDPGLRHDDARSRAAAGTDAAAGPR